MSESAIITFIDMGQHRDPLRREFSVRLAILLKKAKKMGLRAVWPKDQLEHAQGGERDHQAVPVSRALFNHRATPHESPVADGQAVRTALPGNPQPSQTASAHERSGGCAGKPQGDAAQGHHRKFSRRRIDSGERKGVGSGAALLSTPRGECNE